MTHQNTHEQYLEIWKEAPVLNVEEWSNVLTHLDQVYPETAIDNGDVNTYATAATVHLLGRNPDVLPEEIIEMARQFQFDEFRQVDFRTAAATFWKSYLIYK